MSTILSTYEMSTGHCSSQARQRRARPEDVGVDDVGDEVHRRERRPVCPSLSSFSPVDDLVLARVEVVAESEREVLGAEDLARAVRRAVVRAAPALGARVEVEDRLPREVLDPRDADGQRERVGGLAGRADRLHELLGVLRHRLEASRRLQAPREDVRDRRDDVEVLRVRQQVQEEEDERRRASRSPRARGRRAAPGDSVWKSSAKNEPAGAGQGDHVPVEVLAAERRDEVAMAAHCPAVATRVAASQSADLLRREDERRAVVGHVGDHHREDDADDEQALAARAPCASA